MRNTNNALRQGRLAQFMWWTSLMLMLMLAACGGEGGDNDTSVVTTPTSITQQPSAVAARAGASASFTVVATGDGLTYQWQVSQNQGTTWTDIPGAVNATYTVQVVVPELNGYLFRVKVNGAGGASTSSAATLTATAAATPGAISVQPTAQSTVVGGTATFSVNAAGTSLTFQWQLSIDSGVTWVNILNAIAASYTVAMPDLSMNGYQYRVLISDGTSTTTSAAATLAIRSAPLEARLGGAAFYQSQINATVVANANLPATMPLGVAGIASDGTMTWSTALAWVQALNAAHYLGYADWRLPTVTPLNGSAFQFNNVASDPNGYAGKIDLGFNISAPGSQYAGSTASELPFLFYNVLGSVARYSLSGTAQNYLANTNAPLSNVAAGGYWTGQPYGSNGAMAFGMSEGSQYAYVAESWHFHVIVLRSGDSGS